MNNSQGHIEAVQKVGDNHRRVYMHNSQLIIHLSKTGDIMLSHSLHSNSVGCSYKTADVQMATNVYFVESPKSERLTVLGL